MTILHGKIALIVICSAAALQAQSVVGPDYPVSELRITRQSIRTDAQLGIRCATGTISLKQPDVIGYTPQPVIVSPGPVRRIGAFVELQSFDLAAPPDPGRYFAVVLQKQGKVQLGVADKLEDDDETREIRISPDEIRPDDLSDVIGDETFVATVRSAAASSSAEAQFLVGDELSASGCSVIEPINLAEEVKSDLTRYGATPLLVRFAGSVSAEQYRRPRPLQEAKNVIVDIRNAQRQSLGAGIVLGTRGDRLYIMTCRHVVWSDDEKLASISVAFFASPGETFSANVLDLSDPALDLAVLSIRTDTAGLPRPAQLFLGDPSSLRLGTPVRSIGHPGGRPWRDAANVEKFSQRISSDIEFESSIADEGSSGGGLFNACGGLVGMTKRAGNGIGVATPINRLLEKLAEWQLEFSFPAPARCVTEN